MLRDGGNRRPPVVVVTGASAGVGRATARAFGQRGASVGLTARNREALEAAREEIEHSGGRALVCIADVADPAEIAGAAHAVEAAFGPIDIWVNNAMVTVVSPAAALLPEEARRVTEVDYLGTVYGTLEALKRMLPRDRGTIVQVGSALAYRSIPLQSAYCGAKAAIRGFTDSVRSELLHDRSRVRITMVQMPALNTPQFDWCRTRMPNAPKPVPPIYQPEVAARAIVWAAAHDRREVVVGATSLLAIVLNKLVPGLLDRYLAASGYESQQRRGVPVPEDRRDNLWFSPPGDRGAHGSFDTDARSVSVQAWLSRHRVALSLTAAVALAAVAGARREG
jgi:NADP-dependent 3-hydroxy acid dehydrogenase YdfG